MPGDGNLLMEFREGREKVGGIKEEIYWIEGRGMFVVQQRSRTTLESLCTGNRLDLALYAQSTDIV